MSQPVPDADEFETTREHHHPRCVVCSCHHSQGLQIRYKPCPDGGVEADISCPMLWEGYPGIVHGGVIASLLDGAMTNCLFAEGFGAFTVDLQVRYRHPLLIDTPARVTAEITRSIPPVFVVKAKVEQDGRPCATASGRFMAPDKTFRDLWQHR